MSRARCSILHVSVVAAVGLLIPRVGTAYVPPTCGGPIEADRPVHDRSLGEPCDFSFEGEEGTVVTVTVDGESEGFDPRAWLLDPSGEEEAFDDDGGRDGDSLIAEHALRRTGAYVVRVASYGGREGSFKVLLAIAAAAAEPEAEREEEEAETEEPAPDTRGGREGPPRCTGGVVQSGQPVMQKLLGRYCDFIFEGVEGTLVDIAVTSLEPGLDPSVSLFDPEDEEVAFDDDSGGDGNSLIQGYELLATGRYVIRVASYERREGAVELTLDVREP